MKVSGIYHLIDPRNSKVYYVGQSKDLHARFRQHKGAVNRHRDAWVDSLHKDSVSALFDVALYCKKEELDFWEAFSIAIAIKQAQPLTNSPRSRAWRQAQQLLRGEIPAIFAFMQPEKYVAKSLRRIEPCEKITRGYEFEN